ncbi:MAG TPA: ABC transporter permease [Vicinamibacterales bacterium]|nr:ABC transporter permease [Vicinamibacterales bacterium]
MIRELRERIIGVAGRTRALFRPTQSEQDYQDEVAFHLAMREESYRAAGKPSPHLLARRRFGSAARTLEDLRSARAIAPLLDTLVRDLRYAVRTLLKSPSFTAAAIITLAVAIGANGAVFAVMNSVLFRPLPVAGADRLVMLWTELPQQGVRQGRTAYQTIETWRTESRSLSDVAWFDPVSATLSDGNAERVSIARISPNFATLIGVPVMHGRLFTDREAIEQQRVVLISDRLWKSRFAGSEDTIGASIEIDGVPSTIIGILPATDSLPALDVDLWEPYTRFPDWTNRRLARGAGPWFALGKLRAGATVDEARAELTAIDRRAASGARQIDDPSVTAVQPIRDVIVGSRSQLALWLFMGAVLVVLLIAAANVASLSLARNAARARELSIRTSLGASRRRIVGQLVVESIVLVAAAGSLGLAIASWTIEVVRIAAPAALPRVQDARLDPVVIAATFIVCFATVIVIGVSPALTAVTRDKSSLIADAGRSIAGGASIARKRAVLVRTEFALALVLLSAAGLLTRSLWSVVHTDPGFDAASVLIAHLSTPALQDSASRSETYQRIVDEVSRLPGVRHAAVIGDFIVSSGSQATVTTAGRRVQTVNLLMRRDEMTPDLFATVGVTLVGGRSFSSGDTATAPRVAIVNQKFAGRLWPGIDPIGQRFKLAAADVEAPWFTVVGVVRDMRRQGPEIAPIAQMFEPLAQNPSRLETLLVKTTEDPSAIASAVRAAVHRVDRHTSPYGISSLDEELGGFVVQRRFVTSLLAAFAGVALLLSAIGISGLVHYSVATRGHEIAIRMAVGAEGASIVRMIVRDALRISLMGIAVGVAGAVAVGQLGSSLLFGISPLDPWTLGTVVALLTVVTILASYLPARRAANINPIDALRQ